MKTYQNFAKRKSDNLELFTIKNNIQVMSSVDLAKLCVGESKDVHSNFMKKAEKVLGDVVKFYDTGKDLGW